ncbi:ABC transporter substrate-binding protein [Camelimonas abortus]|uniref:ABC transporter substrate-binding protein n=1 Tax=Camelimonas abortus TaxID=1017184 RepID=A0ABV7LCW0_9HYPH
MSSNPALSRRAVLGGLGALAGAAALPASYARAAAPVQARVGFVPVIGASAFYVLDKAGWAREAGLDIQATKFDSGPAAVSALASGTLDLLAIGIAPVAVAYARGLGARVIGAGGIGGSLFLATAPLGESFREAGDAPAQAFAAFRKARGKPARIATLPPGAMPTTAFRYWLKQHRVDPADLEVVTMGIEATQQALLAGAIDGGQVLEPAATIVRQRIPSAVVIATAPQMFPNAPGVVYAATESFLKAQPQAAETFMKLAVRATELVRTKPAEAAVYVQQALGSGLVSAAVLEKALASPAVSFVIDPRSIVESTREVLAFQVELGDYREAPNIDGLFDFGPWDRATGR